MARMNGAPSPKLASKTQRGDYVTHCKICLSAVYTNQARHWSIRPIGIVHTECVVTT